MKKKTVFLKKGIDKRGRPCDNISHSSNDGRGEILRYTFYEEGVQENALVQFAEAVEDECAILESRVLPYNNADDCRQVLLEAYTRHIRNCQGSFDSDSEI